MRGFGLDLSGYSTGKSSLAFVEIVGEVAKAVILRGSPFSKYRHGVDDGQAALHEERDALSACISHAPIAVDVPIDLQGLPFPDDYKFIWELTKRPVDYAFSALAPLADRLGACVARFSAIISANELKLEVGHKIFETYPAGTLSLLGVPHRGYKGRKGRDGCKAIAGKFHFDKSELSDDDLDAIICAVTAAAPNKCRLEKSGLVEQMHKTDRFTDMTERGRKAPDGYVLLHEWPCCRLKVSYSDFQSWISAHKN